MKTKNDSERWWRKPTMHIKQTMAFWNRQAKGYAKAKMTNDNCKEVERVVAECRKLKLRDIVTLGGAVGCRDPFVILKDIVDSGSSSRPSVFFSDLAPELVERARTKTLVRFARRGFDISYHAGQITEVCKLVSPQTRRVLIGVYDARSFFKAHPAHEQELCGFDEYVEQRRTLGQQFLMDWVVQNERHELVSCGMRVRVDAGGNSKSIARVKQALLEIEHEVWKKRLYGLCALQVIGRTEGRQGFFISHWYTTDGMTEMLKSAFPPSDFTIRKFTIAKGTVFAIDPRGLVPTGVVTVLNNVIGNVLPHEQYPALLAIRKIAKPLR